MITRDAIQGFIDGYIYAGGDVQSLDKSVSEWLDNHPTYKTSKEEISQISSDVISYRISKRDALAPSSKDI